MSITTNAKEEELQRKNIQLTNENDLLASENTTLTRQLYDAINDYQKTQYECQAIRQREADLIKQLKHLENIHTSLKLKADSTEFYKEKFHHIALICDQIQKKRVGLADSFNSVVALGRKFQTEFIEQSAEVEKMKADRLLMINKFKFYRRHQPILLKLIDDLAPLAGQLPWPIRRRIDAYASQDLRSQLFGKELPADFQANSDDEMAEEIEVLISGGVRAIAPTKRCSSEKKSDRGNGVPVKRKRNELYHFEENEKNFKAVLQHKLARNADSEEQPISEIAGGHSAIHGKKCPTVREQQAEMMPVKERVALLKAKNDQKVHRPASGKRFKMTEEIMGTCILAAQRYYTQLDHFRKCYKIKDDNAASIFTTPVQNKITRDPKAEAVQEFAAQTTKFVALLKTVPSKPVNRTEVLQELIHTSRNRAFLISDLLSSHQKDAPDHRLILLKSLQSFFCMSNPFK